MCVNLLFYSCMSDKKSIKFTSIKPVSFLYKTSVLFCYALHQIYNKEQKNECILSVDCFFQRRPVILML